MKESLGAYATNHKTCGVHATRLWLNTRGGRRLPHHRLLRHALDSLQHVERIGAVLPVPPPKQHQPTRGELVGVHCAERCICSPPRLVPQTVCEFPPQALPAELPRVLHAGAPWEQSVLDAEIGDWVCARASVCVCVCVCVRVCFKVPSTTVRSGWRACTWWKSPCSDAPPNMTPAMPSVTIT
jgi:hypothetical protein